MKGNKPLDGLGAAPNLTAALVTLPSRGGVSNGLGSESKLSSQKERAAIMSVG